MYEPFDYDVHPTNPPLAKDLNTPRERGTTRYLPDGRLLYLEPFTDTEGKTYSPRQQKKTKQAQRNCSASSPSAGHPT